MLAHGWNGWPDANNVLPGETLKAAEELILAAMEQIEGAQS